MTLTQTRSRNNELVPNTSINLRFLFCCSDRGPERRQLGGGRDRVGTAQLHDSFGSAQLRGGVGATQEGQGTVVGYSSVEDQRELGAQNASHPHQLLVGGQSVSVLQTVRTVQAHVILATVDD